MASLFQKKPDLQGMALILSTLMVRIVSVFVETLFTMRVSGHI